MDNELKNCAHCGKEGRVIRSILLEWFFVRCTDDDDCGNRTANWEDERSAVLAWNRRSAEAPGLEASHARARAAYEKIKDLPDAEMMKSPDWPEFVAATRELGRAESPGVREAEREVIEAAKNHDHDTSGDFQGPASGYMEGCDICEALKKLAAASKPADRKQDIFEQCPTCGKSMGWYEHCFETASGVHSEILAKCDEHGKPADTKTEPKP